ncbi:MAG TPA: hypothetical protein VM840_12430 [Actinomycetota bacterium]|nr:hypothetical protein [Actinomycetota bacterium]
MTDPSPHPRARIEETIARARRSRDSRALVHATVALALLELDEGYPGSARHRLADALALARQDGLDEGVVEALRALALVHEAAGDADAAAEARSEAEEVSKLLGREG